MNLRRLNPRLLLLSGAAALALLAGCVSPQEQARQREISRVLEQQRRGEITEVEALRIIESLNRAAGVGTQGAASTTRPATTTVAARPAPPPAQPVQVTPTPAPTPTPSPAPVAVTPPGPDARYRPSNVIEGRLRSIGSDTLDRIMEDMEKAFVQYHPNLRVAHEGKGSSTAVPALLENRSDIGPMSRAPLPAEIDRFEQTFGYGPTPIRIALDALGVYVHPSNPIGRSGLTLQQLDAIFSSTRRRGAAAAITTWGQLGLTGEWASAPITVYSRNRASGTYGFFKDSALGGGDYRPDIIELPGSSEVIQGVGRDKFGIGYSGFGYMTDAVAAVPIAIEERAPRVVPSENTAVDGSYPLARALFLVVNRAPNQSLSPLTREFLTFALSPVGQDIVRRQGFFPLPSAALAEEQAKIR